MQVWYVDVENRCPVIVVHFLCVSRAQRDFSMISCITSEMPPVKLLIEKEAQQAIYKKQYVTTSG